MQVIAAVAVVSLDINIGHDSSHGRVKHSSMMAVILVKAVIYIT
jgi:hypothetical protein